MEINVDDAKKRVEIWLTNAEKSNEELRNKLKPIYKEYHDKKYLVAVFESGNSDLSECTLGLILHNRKVIAERESAAEKMAMQGLA